MDIESCNGCSLVFDMKKVKFINMYVPDNPEDNKEDEDGDLLTEDYHYNENIVWENNTPLDTWQCPVCKEFNGKGDN